MLVVGNAEVKKSLQPPHCMSLEAQAQGMLSDTLEGALSPSRGDVFVAVFVAPSPVTPERFANHSQKWNCEELGEPLTGLLFSLSRAVLIAFT